VESKSEDSTTILQTRPLLTERFDLIRILGQGGAGTVYHVRDRFRGDREVALKVLVNKDAFDEHTLKRFKAEFEVCQKLSHNNIVRAYELIELEGLTAFTMEYVQGQDLGESIKKRKFNIQEIHRILLQLLNALEELHANGVLHRDIKLENILMTESGVVKLGDLGLMKRSDHEILTRSGILIGTAQYMPPEYITDSEYDCRSDLYAVGVVLYELLTNTRRLGDRSGNKVIKHLIRTKFETPKIPHGDIPSKYHYLIARTMAAEPSKRFQSVTEMKDALQSKQSPAKVPGKIEVQQSLGIKSCLARQRIRKREFCENSLIKKMCIGCLALSLLIVVSGSFYAIYDRVLSPLSISPGVYSGQVELYGNTGFWRKVSLDVDSERLYFRSDLSSCRAAPVDVSTGNILCESGSLQLRLKNAGLGFLSGALIDIQENKQHQFVLELESTDSEKSESFIWTLPRW